MRAEIIYQKVLSLKKKFKTSNPREMLDLCGVITLTKPYSTLKGYTFYANRSVFVVANENLSEEERRIVLCHELAHVILHKQDIQIAPMIDNDIYNMSNKLEYEANLFTAEFLIDDSEVIELSSQDMSYFHLCSHLKVPPELLSFKLFSMIKRGYNYNIPVTIKSNFLK